MFQVIHPPYKKITLACIACLCFEIGVCPWPDLSSLFQYTSPTPVVSLHLIPGSSFSSFLGNTDPVITLPHWSDFMSNFKILFNLRWLEVVSLLTFIDIVIFPIFESCHEHQNLTKQSSWRGLLFCVYEHIQWSENAAMFTCLLPALFERDSSNEWPPRYHRMPWMSERDSSP